MVLLEVTVTLLRLLAAAPLCALLAACVPTPRDLQRSEANSLRPAQLVTPPAGPERVRSVRVRIWADRDYATETPRWQDHVQQQLDRANDVLEPGFGVRLVAASMQSWDRRSGIGEDLQPALAELMGADAGLDVEWVVGFVSSMRVVSTSQDRLGLAALFGKHLVLRGMHSPEETQAIEQGLDLLPRDEIEALVRERRLHKETAVLLHEWAHTLGAFHERDAKSLLAPQYDPRQASFSPSCGRLLRASLDGRLGREPGRADWQVAFRTAAAELDADPAERERALARLDAQGGPPRARTPVQAARDQRLDRVVEQERDGDSEGAARTLALVLNAHPEDPRAQQLSCWLAQRRRLPPATVLAACRAATQVADATGESFLFLANALLAQGDRAEAVRALAQVEPRVPAGTEPATWLYLAQLYDRAGSCTGAEAAAARAGPERGAAELIAECTHLRRRVALPVHAAISADREPAYVDAVRAAEQQALGGHAALAHRQAARLSQAFPGTAGAQLIECIVSSRGGARAQVREACGAAATAAPEAFQPRYLLALADAAEARWAQAREGLTQALSLDESATEAWATLAAVEQRLGDGEALQKLRARYRGRFGVALRPALWPSGVRLR